MLRSITTIKFPTGLKSNARGSTLQMVVTKSKLTLKMSKHAKKRFLQRFGHKLSDEELEHIENIICTG
jgi:hypothetical protein